MRLLAALAIAAALTLATSSARADWPFGMRVAVFSGLVVNNSDPFDSGYVLPDTNGDLLAVVYDHEHSSNAEATLSRGGAKLGHWGADLLAEAVLTPDGAGGWYEVVNLDSIGETNDALTLNHGTVPDGGTWRTLVATPGNSIYTPAVSDDGSGGLYVAWYGSATGKGWSYYLGRFANTGAASAGWPAAGKRIQPWNGPEIAPALAPDGAGGELALWDADQPYVMRYNPDGSVAPGWESGAVGIDDGGGTDLTQLGLGLLPSGRGFELALFSARSSNTPASTSYMLYRFPLDGVSDPGWADNPVAAFTNANRGEITNFSAQSDSAGGAWVTWLQEGKFCAEHLRSDGTFAAGALNAPALPLPDVSFSSAAYGGATLSHDGGLAVLFTDASSNSYVRWFLADGSPDPAASPAGTFVGSSSKALAVYGAGDGAAYALWSQVTSYPNVEDDTAFVSRVAPGSMTSGVALPPRAPSEARFALAGLRPNPAAAGPLSVAFSLPGSAPATLELVDVAGRRLASREVGELGAGDHVVTFAPGTRVPPGLYFVRLTQAGRSLTARGAVVR